MPRYHWNDLDGMLRLTDTPPFNVTDITQWDVGSGLVMGGNIDIGHIHTLGQRYKDVEAMLRVTGRHIEKHRFEQAKRAMAVAIKQHATTVPSRALPDGKTRNDILRLIESYVRDYSSFSVKPHVFAIRPDKDQTPADAHLRIGVDFHLAFVDIEAN